MPLSDHIIKMGIWSVAQTLRMIRGRRGKSTAYYHAITVANPTMARGTIDIKALLAAAQERKGNGERNTPMGKLQVSRYDRSFRYPCPTTRGACKPSRRINNCIGHRGLGRLTIGEYLAFIKRAMSRLIVHLLQHPLTAGQQ